MSYKIPAYMPIDSILIEDIRMKRLIRDMPNCSGIGIVFGLFFHLLKNEKQQCRYDDIDIIADELRTSVPMVITVIEKYGFFSVFEDDLGKKFFSPALDKALVPYFEKCEKNSVSAKIGAEKRKMKLENQKEELRQLSLIDSSQRPLSECSANRIEKNIKEENKTKNKKIKENLSPREEKEEREKYKEIGQCPKLSKKSQIEIEKELEAEKYEKLNEYLLNSQILKDRQKNRDENLSQANRKNQIVEVTL